jgi:hypothetical protein
MSELDQIKAQLSFIEPMPPQSYSRTKGYDYDRAEADLDRRAKALQKRIPREKQLKESFWAITTKYKFNNDPTKDSKNGEDYLNIGGSPGGVYALQELEELLVKSKGKINDEIIAFAKKNLKGGPGAVKLKDWLTWLKNNNRRIKPGEMGNYLSY